MTSNKSGLHPLGHAVLVEMYEPELEKGIIAIPDTVRERTKMVETRAVILEIGSNCWSGEPVRAVVGDRVLVSKYSGVAALGTLDGKAYRLVNDNDIFCRIDEKATTKEKARG